MTFDLYREHIVWLLVEDFPPSANHVPHPTLRTARGFADRPCSIRSAATSSATSAVDDVHSALPHDLSAQRLEQAAGNKSVHERIGPRA